MSLFGGFLVPAEQFALHDTLREFPETIIEIERVVATDELVTPYFWMTGIDVDVFEDAATSDPSVERLKRLDSFEKGTLYRADWADHSEILVTMYTEIGTTILEATGRAEQWELRIRFDDHDHLTRFRDHFRENDLPFTLTELHEVTYPRAPGQYGLTEKQEEALVTAWDMGYFETPREVTLSEIARELGISEQALSNRLRRGYDSLIAHTLRITRSSE
jgi:predicted DNA binding protein